MEAALGDHAHVAAGHVDIFHLPMPPPARKPITAPKNVEA